MNVELTSCDDQTIRERVQAAGVVGAGGAGFPTHIKLQARVDTFLVNAAECEPMLKVDQQLMAQQASRLLRGVHYAMKATGASSGIIAQVCPGTSVIFAARVLRPKRRSRICEYSNPRRNNPDSINSVCVVNGRACQ